MLLLLGCIAAVDPGRSDGAGVAGEAETAPGDQAAWTACADPPGLLLNEALAANTQGIYDEDDEQSDWLEVSLSGDAPLDIAGWGLSQDATATWDFPARTLDPGATLLVFASGKDRAESELHVGFSLSSTGEALFLHMPEGCVADHVELPRTWANESYGRAYTTGAWEHFLEPTPGSPNTTESRPGFAPLPTLTPEGGFYDGEVTVTIEGGPTVRYTTDGSVPGEDAELSSGSVQISGVGQPVPLRARAFLDGLWPSRIATATYMASTEPLDGGVQILSLVVDPPDLWDEETGIYVTGSDYEPYYPYFGANFWEEWERDLHVEAWDGDGTRLFSQDAGIQIAGGYSRAFDQRNFELIARGGYGPEVFSARLFADESIPEFHRLYLRNGGDWCGTQLVDAAVQELLRDASTAVRLPSVDAQAYEPVLVYLNGEFWGVYELKERLDEWYVEAHHDADPDELDRVKLGWTHEANWEVEQGDWEAWEALEELMTTEDLSDEEVYAEFDRTVDVANFAMATVAQGWIANTDWWGNNIRMWRPKTEDGRWRWMVYDFGHGWSDYTYDHLGVSVVTSAPGMRVGNALQNEAFRVALVNAHADLLNTTMAGEWASAAVAALAAEVRPVMPMQRERWCGGASMESWESAVSYAELYAERRADAVDAGVRRYLAPGGPASLSLDVDPPGSGRFQLSVVAVDAPFAGSWYRDTPVTVTASAGEGYTFAGWTDEALGSDATIVLPMSGDTEVVARFR